MKFEIRFKIKGKNDNCPYRLIEKKTNRIVGWYETAGQVVDEWMMYERGELTIE